MSRPSADRASRIVAAAVFFLALYFLLLLPWRDGTLTPLKNRETTTTEQSVVTNPAGKRTVTDTTTTEEPSDDSFLERAFSGSQSIWLVRLAAILLVTFFAGAFTQRVLLADYRFSVGGVEIPALDAAEVAGAVDAIEAGFPGLAEVPMPPGVPAAYQPIPIFTYVDDPRMQFLAFIAELEARLRQLAEATGP